MTITLEIADDSAEDMVNRAARIGADLETMIVQSVFIGGTSVEVTKVTVET